MSGSVTSSLDAARGASSQPWWKRWWRYGFGFEPMRHSWWELLFMRGVFAWFSWVSIGGPSQSTSAPVPHGMATWGPAFSFTWIGNVELMRGYVVPLLAACMILFVLDGIPFADWAARLRKQSGSFLAQALSWPCQFLAAVVRCLPSSITLIPPLVVSVGHGVLGNSQGGIGHATQIVSMVFLVMWLASVWSYRAQRIGWPLSHGFNRYQLSVDWARQTIAASYVVSAVTKLIESKGNWMADTPYFGLQITKASSTGFYDHLVPRVDSDSAALAQYFTDHPLVAQVVIGAALPLELFAFAALLNRRMALIIGALLIGFHSTVTEVMQLGFMYHKMLLFALFVNAPWWLVTVVKYLWNAVTGRSQGELKGRTDTA